MMLTTEEIYDMDHNALDEWIIREVMGWRALERGALEGLFHPDVYIEFPACVFDGEMFRMYSHSETSESIPFSPSRIPESATAALDKLVEEQGWSYMVLRGSPTDRLMLLRALRWDVKDFDPEEATEGFFVVLARRGYYVLGYGMLFPIAASRALCQTYGKPDGKGFVTSKEILDQTGIKTQRTLRQWSERGLLPPARRTGKERGRGSIGWFPYYTLDRAKMICDLKREGYGITRIKRILDIVER